MKPGTVGEMKQKNTYNPKDFAIDGALHCFDSIRDYSKFSDIEMTGLIPCGEYKEKLITIINQRIN
jgi:hypothetical protein